MVEHLTHADLLLVNFMKTLALYNAVEARKGDQYLILPKYGVIVEPSASYAIKEIEAFCKERQLSGDQLNKTFHKSWEKILTSSREELFIEQILHYLTTYGTNFQSSFVYTPNEELEVPDVKVNFLVIRGLSQEELVEKSFALLDGVALKQETIVDVLDVLSECGYVFTGAEDFKNKEALMMVCRETGQVPQDPVEFVRYLVYLATGDTLLIKNKKTINAIKESGASTAVTNAFNKADEESLATVFNRLKPILLAFKGRNKRINTKLNKISRLSKELHKPIAYNILNDIGGCTLKALKAEEANLMNANFFQLARCLNYLKAADTATAKVYQVRNGKFYSKAYNGTVRAGASKAKFIMDLIKKKYDLKGKKFFIPSDVYYALPTSEKNFVGNVPTGTKLVSDEAIAAGVYWENKGGARDLDLSGLAVDGGKVGWNSHYNRGSGEVLYSGDVTNAPSGATEYLRFNKNLQQSYLVMNNVFSGNAQGSKFRIVFGKGDNPSKKHMMNPNDVWFTTPTETLKKESVVGFVTPDKKGVAAIVVNAGFGQDQVSGYGTKHEHLLTALTEKWSNCVYLNDVLAHCGAEVVNDVEDCDVDLTPSKLEKDSIISIFQK